LWVDHFSRFLFGHLQEDKGAKAALESKINFEKFAKQYGHFAKQYGHTIRHIHSDNGVFRSKAFIDAMDESNQTHSFCGVGAHWQNGMVERYIGVISTHARTMLLHVMSNLPATVTAEFWSFSFLHAINIHNVTPRPRHNLLCFAEFMGEDPRFRLCFWLSSLCAG